jgi:replicative DNA helicase
MSNSEKIVLGSLLVNNHLIHDVMPLLDANCFKDSDNSNLYRHILQFQYENKPFDTISISDAMGDDWISFCGQLVSNAIQYGSVSVIQHAKIVLECHRKDLLKDAMTTAFMSMQGGGKSQDIINQLGEFMISLESVEGSQLRNIGESMDQFVDNLESRYQSDGEFVGLTTGLADLDNSIQGMQDGNLVIIAGRPAMGKSVLAMNIGSHNALLGKTSLLFTLEMTEEEIQQRMISSIAQVDYGSIQNAKCVDDNYSMPLIGDAIGKIKKGKFIIDDSNPLSIWDMKSKSIAYARKHGVDLVIVDYLQLLSAKGENRTQQISTISRELKALAKTLKCPVIALSQLNRGLEQRADKRPVMSDLRESGQIEQDADKIIFVYRDEVYNENTPAKGLAELIIGKARNCPKKDTVCVFKGEHQSFKNAEHTAYDIIDSIKNPNNGDSNDFTNMYKKK